MDRYNLVYILYVVLLCLVSLYLLYFLVSDGEFILMRGFGIVGFG